MTNAEEITVTIDNDGNVKVHVRGVKGDACLALTQSLEQALGGEVESREATSEMYEQVSTEERQTTSW